MTIRRDLFIRKPPKTDDDRLNEYLLELDKTLRILNRDVSDALVALKEQQEKIESGGE